MNKGKVWRAMQDEEVAQKLIEIARGHCRLALKYGGKTVLPDQRKAIKAEIEALREERDRLLNLFEEGRI